MEAISLSGYRIELGWKGLVVVIRNSKHCNWGMVGIEEREIYTLYGGGVVRANDTHYRRGWFVEKKKKSISRYFKRGWGCYRIESKL